MVAAPPAGGAAAPKGLAGLAAPAAGAAAPKGLAGLAGAGLAAGVAAAGAEGSAAEAGMSKGLAMGFPPVLDSKGSWKGSVFLPVTLPSPKDDGRGLGDCRGLVVKKGETRRS